MIWRLVACACAEDVEFQFVGSPGGLGIVSMRFHRSGGADPATSGIIP